MKQSEQQIRPPEVEQEEKKSSPRQPETRKLPAEYGGRKKGLDPTRYGDWEKNGRCIDF